MAQRWSALAALQEYWNPVPSTQFERLTTTVTPAARDLTPSSGPCGHLYMWALKFFIFF